MVRVFMAEPMVHEARGLQTLCSRYIMFLLHSSSIPLDVDLVASSVNGGSVLVGEVKWAAPSDAERLLAELDSKARRLPVAAGREVVLALWLKEPVGGKIADRVVTPRQVLDVLR